MRVESPSSPHERRSVSTVRRLNKRVRDSNYFKRSFHKGANRAFMKKLVPHFRRSELYFEWGRSPEGEEGEQYSPRDVYSISRLITPNTPSECYLSFRLTDPEGATIKARGGGTAPRVF